MRTPVTIAVAGLEASGLLLARTFADLPGADVRWLCDPSPEVQLRTKRAYPATVTGDLGDVLADDAVDALVVASPAQTHYELARRALEADKHVFVEPPLALTAEQADALVGLAEARDRRLLVGQPGLFHPALRKLKELVELDRLGEIYYLGAVHYEDEGAGTVWELAADDLAALLYLLDDEPIEVSARSESYVLPGTADVAFCYLRFATGISVHLQVSMLERHTVRRLRVVGGKRTAVFDERDPDGKLTLIESGFVTRGSEPGAAAAPRPEVGDLVRLACAHFVSSIRTPVDAGPARRAAAVVGTLEALMRSAAMQGATVALRARTAHGGRVVAMPLRQA